MKNLFTTFSLIFIFFITFGGPYVWGQASLPLSRTTWKPDAPPGWTDSGTGTYGTDCTGSNGSSSGQLNTTGDYYQVYFTGTPNQLTVYIKHEGTWNNSNNFQIQEPQNGTTWAPLETFTGSGNLIPTACTQKSYNLTSTSAYVRFIYVNKNSGNIRIDDVSITGTSGPCPEPANPPTALILTPTYNSVSGSFTASSGSPTATGYLVLRSTTMSPGCAPVDGNAYAVGNTIGSCTVAAVGASTSFMDNGLASSTTYYYFVFAYNGTGSSNCPNYLATSLDGTTSTLAAPACPTVTGAMINACGGSEGLNEFVVFNSGSDAAVSTFTVLYGTSDPPNANSMAGSNATTSGGFATLSASGCTIVEVTSPATVIPTGSRVIFIPKDFDYNYNFTGLCPGAFLYVVYINTASGWSASGTMANTPSGARYLQVTGGAGCGAATSPVVSYSNSWPGNADGNYVDWSNGPAEYSNSGCSPLLPLPVELTNLTATERNGQIVIKWATASESNNDYFVLERSHDGVRFSDIQMVPGAGTILEPRNYEYTDPYPAPGHNYYRLKQVDYDGSFSLSPIVSAYGGR